MKEEFPQKRNTEAIFFFKNNQRIPQESLHTYTQLTTPHRSFLGPGNETNNWNALTGGRPVGYVQAQPRSWTKDYLEQIQLVVGAGLELWISRFQVRRPNHSTTRPHGLPRYNLKQCSKMEKKLKYCLAQSGQAMWYGFLHTLVDLSCLNSSFFRWSCQCFRDSVHWVYWRYRRDQYGACIFLLTCLVTVNLDFAPFCFATTAFFRSMGSSLKDHSDVNEKVRHLHV